MKGVIEAMARNFLKLLNYLRFSQHVVDFMYILCKIHKKLVAHMNCMSYTHIGTITLLIRQLNYVNDNKLSFHI